MSYDETTHFFKKSTFFCVDQECTRVESDYTGRVTTLVFLGVRGVEG